MSTARTSSTYRRTVATLAAGGAALALGLVGVPQASARPHEAAREAASKGAVGAREHHASFDVRAGSTPAQRKALARRAVVAGGKGAARQLRASLGRQAIFDIDGLTGTPRQVARLDGFLTGPSGKPAKTIALKYVRAHLAAFGLTTADLASFRLQRDYIDIAGLHHLSWLQFAGGVPLFGNGLKANVAPDGRLISVLGSPVAQLAAPARSGTKLVRTGTEAMARARTDLADRSTAAGPNDTSKAVLFQTASGTRSAWETITMSAADPAVHVIDAVTGKVLYRRSLSDDFSAETAAPAKPAKPATGVAFNYFPAAPRGGVQKPVNYTARGWLPANAKKLSGNNTHTFADVIDDNVASRFEEIPPRTAHAWNYKLLPFHLPAVSFCDNPYPCSWNPDVPFSWRTNRNQNAAQVFFFVNNWHDHLAAAPIGFTEAAGNFQVKNKGPAGLGGDAVQANTDDGANGDIDGDGTLDGLPDGNHVDNANMDTPPDGVPPTMQMYLQHSPGTTYPDEDPFSPTNVGDEADTVYHEYTHGLSNRLVIDAAGESTIGGVQAGAMGEAWSDWYAMDYLVDQGLQADRAVDGDVVIFQYDGAGVALDRNEPMDCPVGSTSDACPGTDGAGPGGFTYGDYGKIGGSPEVHNDSEIWSQTLWDLRSTIGSRTSESLVTRAMELSPSNPSYLDERNAILQADEAINHGRHVKSIWKVFAHRGMGFFAGALDGNDSAPGEDFSLPPAPGTPVGTLTGTVSNLDTGAPVAGATVIVAAGASPTNPSAITDAAGHYTISGLVAGTYPKVVATVAGFDGVTSAVTVSAGTTTHDFAIRRDWAAASGGASISDFSGPDFGEGCGPADMIDQSPTEGWSTPTDFVDGLPSADTAKFEVIALPQAITVSEIAIDPSNTCGDGGSASLAGYSVETSPDGTTWTLASEGRFTIDNRGQLNSIALDPAATAGVAFVRLTMKDPQVFDIGGACPGAFSGCDYMDASEIAVYGS
jgi:extracellular elastinolytic metalloproteinase